MDAMGLAQLKRQAAWQAEQVTHTQNELRSAELALEGAKKKVEELRKKLVESKRKSESFAVEIAKAEQEVRKKTFDDRR